MSSSEAHITLFGVDMSGYSATTQLLVGSSGIVVTYLVYGFAQESIANDWKHAQAHEVHLNWWLTFFQFFVGAALLTLAGWYGGEHCGGMGPAPPALKASSEDGATSASGSAASGAAAAAAAAGPCRSTTWWYGRWLWPSMRRGRG